MTTQEIFQDISTAELISYLAAGDNSKDLKSELQRRSAELIASREGKTNNTESDAKYNG